jgi:hypothetical protein
MEGSTAKAVDDNETSEVDEREEFVKRTKKWLDVSDA